MSPPGLKPSRSNLLTAAVALTFVVALNPLQARELSSAEASGFISRLRAERDKHPSLTADFTEEKTTHLLKKPIVTSGTISFSAPDKFRREVKGDNPSLTISNGSQLWIYYPNFKEVELYELGGRGPLDDSIAALTAGLNFQDIEKYYRYDVVREGTGHRIVLRPRSSGLKRMIRELSVFVSPQLRIERTVAELPKNDRLVITYRNQKPDSVPASGFTFQPPPGVPVSKPLGK
ncbi:MAG: outer membrane lipoprotein carrier protein LolA [Chthoniobacteraceae bacterium]